MQKESIKFESSTIFEGLTSLRALFEGKKANINDRPIYRILFDVEKTEKYAKELRFLRAKSNEMDFILEIVPSETIDKLALGTTHGGIIAECGERTLPKLENCISTLKKDGFYVMIQGIEDPYNFGYAIRSLYACGVDGIILDERNWLSAAGVVARSSAGASEQIPIFVSVGEAAADLFHDNGYTVVCADEKTECFLHKTELQKPIFLLVGGERRGISRAVMDKADKIVKIPYGRDFRASLSAASAAAILGYEICRQNFEQA